MTQNLLRGWPAFDTNPPPADDSTEQASPPLLLQYWQTAQRWKWIIVGVMVGALAIGLIATLLTTPKYTAESRIEINRETQNVTKVEGLESPESRLDDEFYQTQYSLLEARSLAERVARKLRLATNEAFFAAHGVDMDGGPIGLGQQQSQAPAERAKREELAVDLLLKNIRIVPIPRSRLVDVRYVSASPDISADIANTWVRQFIEQTLDRRFSSTADARRFLESRLADLGQRLEASERAVVNYSSSRGIVSLGRMTTADGRTEVDRTLLSSDLEALNAALTEATADRIAAQSRAATGSDTPGSTNDGALAGLRQRRAEAAAEYARMQIQFEPDYPAAKALAEQVRTLDAAIAREESRISSSRGGTYAAAAAREGQLRERVDRLKESLNRQKRDTIQYNIYQREADTNRQLYDSLLQRYKEIGVAGVSLSNITIIDVAQVPTAPSSPNLMLNLALAFVVGLGLSLLAVLGLEQIDEGLRDPAAVAQLNVPSLGSVPDFGDTEIDELIGDTKSELSEAYFSIQSNLAFSTDHGFPRSLMMTSSRPAEGKTTSSLALAVALGRTGKRVLLIDADMRSPSIHKFFGGSNGAGLSNFLVGNDNWGELVHETPFKGLHVIYAGPTPPSAAELLSGDRMHLLIEQAGAKFDNVVVDSPPILGLADAPLISRAVEGCAFVAEAEGVAVRGLKSALHRLRQAHAHIYGVIVTKISRKRAAYGYGYGYGYDYGAKKSEA
jgi:polysaccharide biosynthesis transport protein